MIAFSESMEIAGRRALGRGGVLLAVGVLALAAACAAEEAESAACADGTPLRFSFYALYEPVSYSADTDPDSPGFQEHRGYEADLLTALEAMDGAGLRFERSPVMEWTDNWLLSDSPDFDVSGGGITIVESRERDTDGNDRVRFTDGHIDFRQSLLVRESDAARITSFDTLTSDIRVGVFIATTGEARLLQLTGLADDDGALAAGTVVTTPTGIITADGTSAYSITPAGSTPNLEGRSMIAPPSDDMPRVIYLSDEQGGEVELIAALYDEDVDAVAGDGLGNIDAATNAPEGGLVVSAYDPEVEYGSFTVSMSEPELLSCLNDTINYLTDNRAIGYPEWQANPDVFLDRARRWEP